MCTVIGARMSHWKWRETKLQPSRVRSGHQISCCLLSLHFLCDILAPITVLFCDHATFADSAANRSTESTGFGKRLIRRLRGPASWPLGQVHATLERTFTEPCWTEKILQIFYISKNAVMSETATASCPLTWAPNCLRTFYCQVGHSQGWKTEEKKPNAPAPDSSPFSTSPPSLALYFVALLHHICVASPWRTRSRLLVLCPRPPMFCGVC